LRFNRDKLQENSMRILASVVSIALLATPLVAAQAGETASVSETPSVKPQFSTKMSPIGVLFENEAAKAIVAKHLPDLMRSDDIADRASGMTLWELREALQAYAPDLLSDEKLAEIDVELAKLPPQD